MIQIDLPPLVKRLNLFSRQALEMAASECMSQQAAEITVSHVLIQMLAIHAAHLGDDRTSSNSHTASSFLRTAFHLQTLGS